MALMPDASRIKWRLIVNVNETIESRSLVSRAPKRFPTRQFALIFSTSYSPTPHFGGGKHPGGYEPLIRTRPRFLYNVPIPKFHHPTFTRSEVIALTNKQTPLKTSNALRYG